MFASSRKVGCSSHWVNRHSAPGQERSPQPSRQEANFRLRPATNCRHKNQLKNSFWISKVQCLHGFLFSKFLALICTVSFYYMPLQIILWSCSGHNKADWFWPQHHGFCTPCSRSKYATFTKTYFPYIWKIAWMTKDIHTQLDAGP